MTLATWFGLGHARFAPGTVAALSVLPVHWAFVNIGAHRGIEAAMALGVTLLGVWASERAANAEAALLLIDIYYSVLGLKREPLFESMKTWPSSTGLEGWAAVDKTAELLAVARASRKARSAGRPSASPAFAKHSTR